MHDVAAVDTRVDDGKLLQGQHRRLDEKRHEAEFDAVFTLEISLVTRPQIHHRLHVYFVERGENRRRVLRRHQALGNACPQTRHRHAALAASQTNIDCRCG